MKKIVTEFKDFISRGNVMDMAVGVIVGGAFGKITSSLVNDVFMPFLGWVIGDIDLTALNITLSPAVMEGDTVVKEAVVMGIGSFLATILLRLGHPDRQNAMREELFQRMVFNILMDNTDDHERNHSISLNLADGYYDLTPAYDVVPSLQNLGYQALIVGTAGAESSLENALTQINEYAIKKSRAIALVRQVATIVDRWVSHFSALGVSPSDMELLASSIDRDALRLQRQAFL